MTFSAVLPTCQADVLLCASFPVDFCLGMYVHIQVLFCLNN